MANLDEISALLEQAAGTQATRDEQIAALKRLDELAADKTANMDKDLRHYLQRRSYAKALDYLSET